jgi:branched-chain amino acid transport system ATP-binding protein
VTPIIETRDLTRAFGGILALDGVSLRFEPGPLYAVIGPNGAGKSTFFNVISGVMAPTRGEVFFRGERVTGLPAHRIARLGMARTLQVKSVFATLTVEQNLWVAAQAREPWARRWGRATASHAIAARVEDLLDRLALRRLAFETAGNLAYGDLCLVEVAMALATEPRLLLLDEPTAGMSPEETRRTARMIRELAGQLAVVLVEHDMEMVLDIADRVCVFHQGRLLAEGTPAEITRNPAVQDAYLGVEHAAG